VNPQDVANTLEVSAAVQRELRKQVMGQHQGRAEAKSTETRTLRTIEEEQQQKGTRVLKYLS
jgi:DnaJ-domain-containing protein 1